MAYYSTGWINNPMNYEYYQDIAGFNNLTFGNGNNNNAMTANAMGGQVNNYENHDVVAGQTYNVENQNYYDNYHHRYNHYYVTDNNYIQDHYMDYNVYHHDTNTVYNGEDYHEPQTIFVDYDENNGWEYNRPYAYTNANVANGQSPVQENTNRRRKTCNNTTIRRIPCGHSNNVWNSQNNCNCNNNSCCNNKCSCNNNCTCKCKCKCKNCNCR